MGSPRLLRPWHLGIFRMAVGRVSARILKICNKLFNSSLMIARHMMIFFL
jgi:hypothetical protein